MMNITGSASPAHWRIEARAPGVPSVHRTAALPSRAWMIGVGLVFAVGAAMHAGAAHADEDLTLCDHTAVPAVLAKRPAAGISYAPRRLATHRRHGPAALRKPAPEVGCTAASLLPAAVPMAAAATTPVAPAVIPPAPASMSLLAAPPLPAATDPVVADAVPAALATPNTAVAAAAAASPNLVAVPLGLLAAGVAICFISHGCGGHSGTTGGHSLATAGTVGTTGTVGR